MVPAVEVGGEPDVCTPTGRAVRVALDSPRGWFPWACVFTPTLIFLRTGPSPD